MDLINRELYINLSTSADAIAYIEARPKITDVSVLAVVSGREVIVPVRRGDVLTILKDIDGPIQAQALKGTQIVVIATDGLIPSREAQQEDDRIENEALNR